MHTPREKSENGREREREGGREGRTDLDGGGGEDGEVALVGEDGRVGNDLQLGVVHVLRKKGGREGGKEGGR
jgi:hypothetical protein